MGETGRGHVQTILRLTHRMDGLLSTLLEYAQIGESAWTRTAVHLPTLVDEVRELLAARIPQRCGSTSTTSRCRPMRLGSASCS